MNALEETIVAACSVTSSGSELDYEIISIGTDNSQISEYLDISIKEMARLVWLSVATDNLNFTFTSIDIEVTV